MHRVTVEEAARLLGIEKESVRKRIYRGLLRADKEPDGTLRVYIDRTDRAQGQYTDNGHGHESDSVKDELLASLRDQIEYLRQESERKDAIIMQMAQANATLAARVPELEAPQEPAESSETDSKEADKGAAPPAKGERRSWWRRLFST